MKIVLTRGISGAGKSTWAESQKSKGFFVVSRDEIRSRFFNLNEYFAAGGDENFENYITTIEKNEIAAHINRGHDLIIDNTNLEPRYIQWYVNIFAELGVAVEDVSIREFDCDPETSMARNADAGKNVDAALIVRQYALFQNSVKIEDFQRDGEWVECDTLGGTCRVKGEKI